MMTMLTEDEAPVCKYCGNIISSKRQSDPNWDGETCNEECEEALNESAYWDDGWSELDEEEDN